MYSIQVPARINQIISVFYFLGLWQGDNGRVLRKRVSKILHLLVYMYCPISLVAEVAFKSDNVTEQMFLGSASIVSFILTIRLYYFMWNEEKILGFIREMGAHSLKDCDNFNIINNRISLFVKLVTLLEIVVFYVAAALTIISLPLFSNEKHLPLNMYFPIDWKNNELVYWLVFLFVVYTLLSTGVCTFMNVIIWYLMMSCAIKYEIFGIELKRMGVVNQVNDETITKRGNQHSSHAELIALIKSHQNRQG